MRDFRPMNTPGYQQDWTAREAERAAREKEIRADYAARNRAMYPLAGMVAALTLLLIAGIYQNQENSSWTIWVLTAAIGPIALAKVGFCFIAMDSNSSAEDYRGLIPAPYRRAMLANSLQLCLLALLTAFAFSFAPDSWAEFLQKITPVPSWALIPLLNAPALLLTTCAVDRLTCRPRPG